MNPQPTPKPHSHSGAGSAAGASGLVRKQRQEGVKHTHLISDIEKGLEYFWRKRGGEPLRYKSWQPY